MTVSLDNGNIISLIALEVGVLAGFFALLMHYINNYVVGKINDVEENIKDIRSTDYYLGKISKYAIEIFAKQDSIIQTQDVLLFRISSGKSTTNEALQDYHQNHRINRFLINRLVQTLILFSTNNEWRQSALKQLSERYGDASTLKELVELERHEKFLKTDLSVAIKTLEDRLTEAARTEI